MVYKHLSIYASQHASLTPFYHLPECLCLKLADLKVFAYINDHGGYRGLMRLGNPTIIEMVVANMANLYNVLTTLP